MHQRTFTFCDLCICVFILYFNMCMRCRFPYWMPFFFSSFLSGLTMVIMPRRSSLWRSIYTILRWSRGKDRSSLIWTEIIPASYCLNATLCAHESASASLLNWNRLLRIQLYSLIGWVCVHAWKHTGRLWIICQSNQCWCWKCEWSYWFEAWQRASNSVREWQRLEERMMYHREGWGVGRKVEK